MNYIEENLFTMDEYEEALNLLVPPNTTVEDTILYKARLRQEEPKKILAKANTFLVQYIAPKYFSFFLYYLALSGEETDILTIDNGVISISKDIYDNEIPRDLAKENLDILTYGYNVSTWLFVKDIKNPKLKKAFDLWGISKKEIVNNDYYIQLLPAYTTVHLDELYRVICTYA